MKIAVDTSPLESGHRIRGVGSYVRNLKEGLEKIDKENSYLFYNSISELQNTQFDINHIPYFDPFFIHLPVIKRSKIVVTVHDLTPLVFPDLFPVGIKGSVKWQINKRLLSRADAIVTDSDASKKDVHRLTGIPHEKIHTVYLSAGPQFKLLNLSQTMKQKLMDKYKLPDEFVLYVGDVTANKNLPRLIDAIKEINVTLVLVGKAVVSKEYDASNPWNHDLVVVQDNIKSDKRFIPLGFVDQEDLVSLYNMAQLCVLPSIYEGFGLPVLEAMQTGCPVVTTKSGSLPEVGGDAVYYVDPYDVQSIANGIGEVFFSNDLRTKLIKTGLKHAEKFTLDKSINNLVNVYQQLSK